MYTVHSTHTHTHSTRTRTSQHITKNPQLTSDTHAGTQQAHQPQHRKPAISLRHLGYGNRRLQGSSTAKTRRGGQVKGRRFRGQTRCVSKVQEGGGAVVTVEYRTHTQAQGRYSRTVLYILLYCAVRVRMCMRCAYTAYHIAKDCPPVKATAAKVAVGAAR